MKSFEILFFCLLFEEIIMLGWYDFPNYITFFLLHTYIPNNTQWRYCFLHSKTM